jgi:hypothetical protein
MSAPRSGGYVNDDAEEKDVAELAERASRNLRLLRSREGEVIGRACITPGWIPMSRRYHLRGVVTVGGLQGCALTGIAGFLVGNATRASRDEAVPLVEKHELARWASEQSELVSDVWNDVEEQQSCAQYIRLCGGETRALPIAQFRDGWVSMAQVRELAKSMDKILICSRYEVGEAKKFLPSFQLGDNVFVTQSNGIPAILQSSFDDARWWPHPNWDSGSSPELAGAVMEAVAEAWEVPVSSLKQQSEKFIQMELGRAADKVITGRARVLARSR